MRLPVAIDTFADIYLVPHADAISWAAMLVIFVLFGYICYRARANKPLKGILPAAVIIWAIVLVLLTVITFASEEGSFSFLRV